MFFVAMGLLICQNVTGLVTLGKSESRVHFIGELTLILVLFIDALRINFSVLRRNYTIPLRLLIVALPLCIVFGALAGMLVVSTIFSLGASYSCPVLAPTDAALGQVVVSSEQVPQRMR